ncbi:MAG: hypothetical protein HC909_01550 [Blastochloris sp.]|nr:hypothetical protein [Blastochloris sp.]
MDDILRGVRIACDAPDQPLELALLCPEDVEQFRRRRHDTLTAAHQPDPDREYPEVRVGPLQFYFLAIQDWRSFALSINGILLDHVNVAFAIEPLRNSKLRRARNYFCGICGCRSLSR